METGMTFTEFPVNYPVLNKAKPCNNAVLLMSSIFKYSIPDSTLISVTTLKLLLFLQSHVLKYLFVFPFPIL